MRAQTLGDALVDAGLSREEMELGAAVTKFLKSGGSIASAHAVVDASADRMSGRGRTPSAVSGLLNGAPTRQPVEDGAATALVPDEGQRTRSPPSSFNRGGEGRNPSAQSRHPVVVLPVREPTFAQRSVAAMVAKASAITVLDTLKIDGRPIGDWTVGEARSAGRLKTREGAILIEASRVVANAPSNALIRNVVKPSEMQRIMQTAAETSDAV